MGMSEMVGRRRRKKRGMRGEKGWMRHGKGKKELQMWEREGSTESTKKIEATQVINANFGRAVLN